MAYGSNTNIGKCEKCNSENLKPNLDGSTSCEKCGNTTTSSFTYKTDLPVQKGPGTVPARIRILRYSNIEI